MPYRITAGFGMSNVHLHTRALAWYIACTASYHPGMDSHSIAVFIYGSNVVCVSFVVCCVAYDKNTILATKDHLCLRCEKF